LLPAGLLLASGVIWSGAAAAAAATPAAKVTPTSRLADGQVMSVSGTGFTPNHQVQTIQCSGTVASPPKDQQSCEGLTLDSSSFTNGDGAFVNSPSDPTHQTHGIAVYDVPGHAVNQASIRCGPTDPCVLYVGDDFHDFSYPHVFIGLQFAGSTGSSAPVTATTPRTAHKSSAAPEMVAGVVVVAGLALAGTGIRTRRRRRQLLAG